MNRESIETLLRVDRALLFVRIGSGCAFLGLLVAGRLMGLL